MNAPAFGKGEEMKIVTGPIPWVRPGWGLKEDSLTAVVSNDSEGHPHVLAAQMLCGAAVAGVRVLMLLPGDRVQDDVWTTLVALLTDSDGRSAARSLGKLPIVTQTSGTGREKARNAELVYAPGLSARELRDLSKRTNAPILVVGQEFDGESVTRSSEIIRVGGDALVMDSEGFEVPVVYDPSGPFYRPA